MGKIGQLSLFRHFGFLLVFKSLLCISLTIQFSVSKGGERRRIEERMRKLYLLFPAIECKLNLSHKGGLKLFPLFLKLSSTFYPNLSRKKVKCLAIVSAQKSFVSFLFEMPTAYQIVLLSDGLSTL